MTLYSHFGGDEDPPLGNTDGFEEWGVELYDLATKAGTKFNDLDGDGVRDAGEPGLPGWTIYVDYNGNSVLDLGEPSAVTAANGTYTINAIVPGTYRVREVAQADWVCTFPNPCYHEETFLAGSHLTGNDFGNFQLIDKTGSKYVDDEGDGSLSGDSKYTAGWTINLYKDDGDGVPDAGDTKSTTTTNATGDYTFANLGPGTYFVCEDDSNADWIQTFPNTVAGEVIDTCDDVGDAAFGYKFTASSGTNETGNHFGNFQLIDKTGFKFNDNDMDGVYEPSPSPQNDTKLTDWTIELWKLVSGTWQWVATDTTDATGYSFANLGPGTYAVCEVIQANWTQSYPVSSVPVGETLFDCTTLTPHAGGTFAPKGFQFTASSGVNPSANNFGNFLVPPGCALTQGYWKTHSVYGPAAHPDDTWDLITAAMTGAPGLDLGPDTQFFDSGQTWIQVFKTNPKGGNAWYILAHQYMAAVLNQLNGAGDVPGLATNMANAYILLDYYDGQKNIPKNGSNVLTTAKDRDEAIAIAGFLASYNEGQLGVPHCGESGFAGVGLSLNVVWPIALAPIAASIMRRRRRRAA